MHLVAALSRNEDDLRPLSAFRDAQGRFHIHPVAGQPVTEAIGALELLELAGAVILDEESQQEAAGRVRRLSLEAQDAGAVDTVAVTGAGLIGEFNAGRALGEMLASAGWDGRNAAVTILGGGPRATAMARELGSAGIASLVVLSTSRPEAEAAVPQLAAGVRVAASAYSDPLMHRYLADSDLLIRLEPRVQVPGDLLGPHLTVVDLGGEAVSSLRRHSLATGALSFNAHDFGAYFLSLSLSHILGGRLNPEPFLQLYHAG